MTIISPGGVAGQGHLGNPNYNHYRSHSSLGYMTPAKYANLCEDVGCVKQRKHKTDQAEWRENLSHKVDQKTGAGHDVSMMALFEL